jgi:CheY-like chemotaxis protein
MSGQSRSPASAGTPSVARGNGTPILLAEDNPTNQAVAVNILRRRGFRVEVASNGREAVDALRREPFAAVLMDCQMPVLDGYAATGEIRGLEGDVRRTPIIAMTAHAMEGDRERCIAAGMDDYVAKPLRADELDAVLRRWVGSPEAVVMDPAALQALTRAVGDEAIVEEICDLFLAEAGPRLAAMRTAAASGDAEWLRSHAHTLKGSASNVGAALVASVAGELEERCRVEDLEGVAAVLTRLGDAVESTRAALGRTAA